jgi:hypothetical protein
MRAIIGKPSFCNFFCAAALTAVTLTASAAGAAPAQSRQPALPDPIRFTIEVVIQIGEAVAHRKVECDWNVFCTIFEERGIKISTIRSLHDRRVRQLQLHVSTRGDCCFLSGGQSSSILETFAGPDRFKAELFRGRGSRRLEDPINTKVGSIYILARDIAP